MLTRPMRSAPQRGVRTTDRRMDGIAPRPNVPHTESQPLDSQSPARPTSRHHCQAISVRLDLFVLPLVPLRRPALVLVTVQHLLATTEQSLQLQAYSRSTAACIATQRGRNDARPTFTVRVLAALGTTKAIFRPHLCEACQSATTRRLTTNCAGVRCLLAQQSVKPGVEVCGLDVGHCNLHVVDVRYCVCGEKNRFAFVSAG